MYASPYPYAEFHHAGMEALIEFARAQFTAFERLSALNFNVARSVLDSANFAFRSLTEFGIRSSELAQTKSAAASPGIVDAEAETSIAKGKTSENSKGSKGTKRKPA